MSIRWSIAVLPLLLGALVGLATPFDRVWYAALDKPPWTPPSWVFGPVWTVLYILMGVAAATQKKVAPIFWVQLLLNLAWTPVFFGMQRPRLALVILVLLLPAAALTYASLDRSPLLVPYLAWLLVALSLNMWIAIRN